MQEQISESFTKASDGEAVLTAFCHKVFDKCVSEGFFNAEPTGADLSASRHRLVTFANNSLSLDFEVLDDGIEELYFVAWTDGHYINISLRGRDVDGVHLIRRCRMNYGQSAEDSLASLFDTNESMKLSPTLPATWSNGQISLAIDDHEHVSVRIANLVNDYYLSMVGRYRLLKITSDVVSNLLSGALGSVSKNYERAMTNVGIRVVHTPPDNEDLGIMAIAIDIISNDEAEYAGGVKYTFPVADDYSDVCEKIMATNLATFDKETPEQQREMVRALTAELLRTMDERDQYRSKLITQELMTRITQPKEV